MNDIAVVITYRFPDDEEGGLKGPESFANNSGHSRPYLAASLHPQIGDHLVGVVATLLWGQFRWPGYEDWVEGLDAGIDRQDGPGCGGGDGLGAVAGGPPSCASPEGEASRKGSCLAAAFGHPRADSVWSPSGRRRAGCCCSLLTFGGLSVGLSQPGFGFSFWRQLPLVFCTYDADVWRDPPTLKALQCWE